MSARKRLGGGRVLGDDGVGQTGVMAADVVDGLVETADDLQREDEVQIFGVPVLFSRWLPVGHDGAGLLVGPHLDAGFGQPLGQSRQHARRPPLRPPAPSRPNCRCWAGWPWRFR